MAIKIVYMTAGSMDEASKIANELIQQQLAACINIIDGMRSVYKWEGIIKDEREVVMIAKTHKGCLPELKQSVKRMHSYKCPCIVELDVTGGNNAFLDWVKVQVDPPTSIDIESD